MVVGKDHRRGVVQQRLPQHLARMNARPSFAATTWTKVAAMAQAATAA